jgi:hypothetical protein
VFGGTKERFAEFLGSADVGQITTILASLLRDPTEPQDRLRSTNHGDKSRSR